MPFVKKVSLQKNIFGYGFALKSERPCIVDVVMPNSVAAAANVSCGDSLLTVNGVDVSHLPHADVASLIWSAGSTITIEFLSYDETSLTICDASRPPQRDSVFEDIFLSHSPLFGAQTAASIHKRSAVVMFIGKVPIDVTHSADVPHILQRIPYLVDKAESLIQGPNTSNASCLLEIFTDSLRIRLLHRAFQYPTNGILFTDVVKDDTRFFFLVTRGHNRHLDVRINFQTRSLRSNRSRDGSSGPSMASCCLFRCLPPKLLGHRSHATLVKQFDLACHRDRLTGECAEFPRDATSVVSTLRELDDVWLRHIEQPTDHLLASSPVDNHEQMRALDLSTVGSQFSTPVAAFPKSTTSSVFKRPGSVLRPSTSRIFGKLTKAAGYIRDRWNDRRNSSVHIPGSPLIPGLNQTVQPIVTRSSISQKLSASLASLAENIPPFSQTSSSSWSTVNSVSKSDPTVWRISFDRLLSDPEGILAFQAFLSSEFSAENLEFWCVARNWRIHFPGSRAVKEAKKLFTTYLDAKSIKAVNVDAPAMQSAASQLTSPSPIMFVEAERQIYNLMKTDCYPRFLASSFYRDLLPEKPTINLEPDFRKRSSPTVPEVVGRRMSIDSPDVHVRCTPTRKVQGRKSTSICLSPNRSALRISQRSVCSQSVFLSESDPPRSHFHSPQSLSTTYEKCAGTPAPMQTSSLQSRRSLRILSDLSNDGFQL